MCLLLFTLNPENLNIILLIFNSWFKYTNKIFNLAKIRLKFSHIMLCNGKKAWKYLSSNKHFYCTAQGPMDLSFFYVKNKVKGNHFYC